MNKTRRNKARRRRRIKRRRAIIRAIGLRFVDAHRELMRRLASPECESSILTIREWILSNGWKIESEGYSHAQSEPVSWRALSDTDHDNIVPAADFEFDVENFLK